MILLMLSLYHDCFYSYNKFSWTFHGYYVDNGAIVSRIIKILINIF